MTDLLPKNLGFDLVRSTETAAMTAGYWMGLGRPADADRAATAMLLDSLKDVDINAQIAIGEPNWAGEKILDDDMRVGSGKGPEMDMVIDAIDGRSQLSMGSPGVLSAIAIAPRGCMWTPAPAAYMEKIVVDRQTAPYLVREALDAPAGWTLALVARAKNKSVKDLVVFVLNRERHKPLIEEIRAAGAHVMLRPDGDIAGALKTCLPDIRVDIMMGSGGVVEGLMAACAAKATRGAMLGRLSPQSAQERYALEIANLDTNKIYTQDEMITSDEVYFAATGISGGSIFHGVEYIEDRATTNSLILRGRTKTRRFIFAEHLISEKMIKLPD